MSKILVTKYYPMVETGLKSTTNVRTIMNHIKNYMDMNSEILLDSGLNYRLMFREEDKNLVPHTLKVPVENIPTDLRSAGLTNESFVKWNNNPWIWSLVLSIRYFTKLGKDKEVDNLIMYYSLGIYSSLHFKYFQKFLPNENIMDYTINNLSNKYYIKKYGNLARAIMVTSKNSHDSYKDRLVKGTDEDLMYYASQLESRLNAFVKGIFRKYEENRKGKKYFNKENESYDEEDYNELDNVSFKIGRLTDKVSLSITSNRIRLKEVRLSATLNSVNEVFLKETLEEIISNELQEINKLIAAMLQVYVIDDENSFTSIPTAKFMIESMKTINRSNTTNPRAIYLKDTIDLWLNKHSKVYRDTTKTSTRTTYRKAVYQYFVLSTQAIAGNR